MIHELIQRLAWLGHDGYRLDGDPVIYFDPYEIKSGTPADIILISHEHFDHCSPADVDKIQKEDTVIVTDVASATKLQGDVKTMKAGERFTVKGVEVEAVPAYNIVHKRSSGDPFHVKGEGNGYIITFADKRVYVGGDTENTPEMKALKGIDIAFLPMNLPYTMTPEMVADAARSFKPKVLYPYHYGDTDPATLVALLEDQGEITVRIREMP